MYILGKICNTNDNKHMQSAFMNNYVTELKYDSYHTLIPLDIIIQNKNCIAINFNLSIKLAHNILSQSVEKYDLYSNKL